MKTLFHWMLALGMLITGSINTISTKAADQAWTTNRYGERVQFNHPFFQAVCMFLGEFLCLLAFHASLLRGRMTGKEVEKAKPFNRFVLLLPALCDMTATSTMYVGLSLTDASIFQMLRGSVVIFTGVFRVVFLKKKLAPHHWLGMFFVMAGTAVVGTTSLIPACSSGSSSSGTDQSKATLGNILIIFAQIIVAVQMVVEEKFIDGYNIPALQVVGWEGIFGFCTLSVVLTIMYFVQAPSSFCAYAGGPYEKGGVAYPAHCDHFEDAYDAFVQMGNSGMVTGMLLLNLMSIAFFNYFGVSVTKHINASTRMVLDSLRTMIIWAFSLGMAWEQFCYVQVIGFVTLLTGTMVYNELIKVPCLRYASAEDDKLSGGAAAVADAEGGYASLLDDTDRELLLGSTSVNTVSTKGRK